MRDEVGTTWRWALLACRELDVSPLGAKQHLRRHGCHGIVIAPLCQQMKTFAKPAGAL